MSPTKYVYGPTFSQLLVSSVRSGLTVYDEHSDWKHSRATIWIAIKANVRRRRVTYSVITRRVNTGKPWPMRQDALQPVEDPKRGHDRPQHEQIGKANARAYRALLLARPLPGTQRLRWGILRPNLKGKGLCDANQVFNDNTQSGIAHETRCWPPCDGLHHPSILRATGSTMWLPQRNEPCLL